jgi:hypothetical protein
MADLPNMSLSETISVAIQRTRSHIVDLKARQIEAETFAQTLESIMRVTDTQKSRLELIPIFRLIFSDFLMRDAIMVPGKALSKDEEKIKATEYNLAIQLQLVTMKLEELSSDELEGENIVAQLRKTIRETGEKYIKCLADAKSPRPHPHSNAVSFPAIAGRPGLPTDLDTDNMSRKSSGDINSLNMGTVVASGGARQTIVCIPGRRFELGNAECTDGSTQLVVSALNMESWTSKHYRI